ncbi:MAG TPA: TRZ/ATZ family hydrolase, partial [Alcanivorax sp.]|nr:TRZ/ATZ family hydrolase [Alcanivorax sp.]
MQNQPSPDHQHADLIIKAGWIAPVAPETGALADHALVVRGDTIVDLLPTPLADQKWRADEVVELGNHLLIPGLVNAHTHAAMNLFRGLADDLPLMTWLEQH